MKYLLLATGLALGLAMQPAQAEQQGTDKSKANQAETMHAPTNRVGEQVPTMKSEENEPDVTKSTTYNDETNADAVKSGSGENKAETLHPPTNRVGEQVPTMKSAKNKDDQAKSKTYYHGKDSDTTTTE
jgi:hypothetical protein